MKILVAIARVWEILIIISAIYIIRAYVIRMIAGENMGDFKEEIKEQFRGITNINKVLVLTGIIIILPTIIIQRIIDGFIKKEQ